MHKALTHMKINIDHDTQSIEMKADDHVPLSHPREFAFLFSFSFWFYLTWWAGIQRDAEASISGVLKVRITIAS